MNHQLSPPATEILVIIRAAFERIRALPEPERGGSDWYERWSLYSEEKRSLDHGLPVGDALAEWIGNIPDGAERRRFHRALDELEAQGLIRRRRRWGVRATHLELVEQPAAENASESASVAQEGNP